MRGPACIFLLIPTLLFCQCASLQKTYTIKGVLPDDSCNGKRVSLYEDGFQYNTGFKKLDSAIVQNRRFVFKRPVGTEPLLGRVFVHSTPAYSTDIIFEPGEITIDFKGRYNSTVTGTPLNDEYYREITIPNELSLRALNVAIEKFGRPGSKGWTQEDQQAYMAYFMKNIYHLSVDVQKREVAYIEKYIGYPKMVSFMIRRYVDTKQELTEQWISRLPELYQTHLKAEIAKRERRKKELMATLAPLPERDLPDSVSVGRKLTDLALKDTAGEDVLLSELVKKNKVTVLDFWASWCGPCLQEMPFMKSLHEEFGPQGMGLVGISTDKGEAAWKKALARHDMPWLQTISPQAGNIYYVIAIPHVILIDRNGTIVARQLRGEQLKNKIKELLQE